MSTDDGLKNARSVGVIGGTFDPVHIGHLVIADRVKESLALDTMLFVPAWINPLKLERPPTKAEHRLEMLRRAIADRPDFEISLVELEHKGPSYTVETLAALQESLGPRTSLTFILGADSVIDLPRWHRPERLIRLATLALVPRPGFTPDLEALECTVPGLRDAIRHIDAPNLEISATELRARVAAGRSIRYLVPDRVREYIEAEGLYTDDLPGR